MLVVLDLMNIILVWLNEIESSRRLKGSKQDLLIKLTLEFLRHTGEDQQLSWQKCCTRNHKTCKRWAGQKVDESEWIFAKVRRSFTPVRCNFAKGKAVHWRPVAPSNTGQIVVQWVSNIHAKIVLTQNSAFHSQSLLQVVCLEQVLATFTFQTGFSNWLWDTRSRVKVVAFSSGQNCACISRSACILNTHCSSSSSYSSRSKA